MQFLPFVVAVLMSCLGVLGDYFLRIGGVGEASTRLKFFMVGMVIYAFTAVGWYYAINHMKLAWIGVIYSTATLLLLVLLGTFYFKESLSLSEWAGVGAAFVAIVLLARFA